mmetsp:Transcript_88545/g.271049  ORF Transcript_88545/g.271049 Transcript_88545/m.271049 type:complete len:225 (-) Transcript_88545:269-943(-)
MRKDCVHCLEADCVYDLHGTPLRPKSNHPGPVHVLGRRHAARHKPKAAVEPRHEEGVANVAVLLFVEADRDHVDLAGEFHDALVNCLVCGGVPHHLPNVTVEDRVGEMQSEETFRPARHLREIAREQGAGVRGEDRARRRRGVKLGVHCRFDRGDLRHVLTDEVALGARLTRVSGVADAIQGCLRIRARLSHLAPRARLRRTGAIDVELGKAPVGLPGLLQVGR